MSSELWGEELSRRSSTLLSSRGLLELIANGTVLFHYQASPSTPLHGVVVSYPPHSSVLQPYGPLLYTQFCFSSMPHFALLLRNPLSSFSAPLPTQSAVVSLLLPSGEYSIESTPVDSSLSFRVSLFRDNAWLAVVDAAVNAVFLLPATMEFNRMKNLMTSAEDEETMVSLQIDAHLHGRPLELSLSSIHSNRVLFHQTVSSDLVQKSFSLWLPPDDYQLIVLSPHSAEWQDVSLSLALADGSVLVGGPLASGDHHAVWEFSTRYLVGSKGAWYCDYHAQDEDWFSTLSQNWNRVASPPALHVSRHGYFWSVFVVPPDTSQHYSNLELTATVECGVRIRVNGVLVLAEHPQTATRVVVDVSTTGSILVEGENTITVETFSDTERTLPPLAVTARLQRYEEQRMANGAASTYPETRGAFASSFAFDGDSRTVFATRGQCKGAALRWSFPPFWKKIVSSYTMSFDDCANAVPTAWRVFGLDAESEVLLDRVDMTVGCAIAPTPHQVLHWSFRNTAPFSAYKLVVDKCGGLGGGHEFDSRKFDSREFDSREFDSRKFDSANSKGTERIANAKGRVCSDRQFSIGDVEFMTAKPVDNCYVPELDQEVRSGFVASLPCPAGFRGSVMQECQNGQLLPAVDACEEIEKTEFFFEEVNWDLTMNVVMEPRDPVLRGIHSMVMVDGVLPAGIRVDPISGRVQGKPKRILSRRSFTLFVNGPRGKVEASVMISIHPFISVGLFDNDRLVLSILFGVIWILLVVISLLLLLKH